MSEASSGQLMVGQEIPRELLSQDFEGQRVPRQSLAEILAGPPTLLVFLRHFG